MHAVRTRFQIITNRFATFQAASTCTSTSHCSSAWPCPSPSVRSAIPASRSTTRASSAYWKVLLHGSPTVGGWTDKQIHQAVLTMASTNSRYDLGKLKEHALLERDGSRYATGSPPKVFRWPSYFYSSTSVSAVPWPTAAFTTLPTVLTHPTANSRPPITKPTTLSRTSSTCSPPHNLTYTSKS